MLCLICYPVSFQTALTLSCFMVVRVLAVNSSGLDEAVNMLPSWRVCDGIKRENVNL